jgi:hypothetical protein
VRYDSKNLDLVQPICNRLNPISIKIITGFLEEFGKQDCC